jgi:hypothetical protein
MQQQITVSWDESKFNAFGNGPQRHYVRQFPGSTEGLSLQGKKDENEILFEFDSDDPHQLMFANIFCKYFNVKTNLPIIIKKYRSIMSYPRRSAWAVYRYAARRLSWAHITRFVREQCEEYGLVTVQIALA